MFVRGLKRGVLIRMFLGALKRAGACSWYELDEDRCLWQLLPGRVVLPLSKKTALGSSLLPVVGRVCAGSRCITMLVGWLGRSVLDAVWFSLLV
jgi:hypothetical protein